MVNGFRDIILIREKFKKEFMLNGNNNDFYIFYVGVDKRERIDYFAPLDKFNEDCLTVYIQRGMDCPSGLKIPEEYHGISICKITRLLGEIPPTYYK